MKDGATAEERIEYFKEVIKKQEEQIKELKKLIKLLATTLGE